MILLLQLTLEGYCTHIARPLSGIQHYWSYHSFLIVSGIGLGSNCVEVDKILSFKLQTEG